MLPAVGSAYSASEPYIHNEPGYSSGYGPGYGASGFSGSYGAPATVGNQMVRTSSDKSLSRQLGQHKQYARRPALERMQEAREAQLLSQPQGPAGRAFLLEKYAKKAAASSSPLGRPVGGQSRKGKLKSNPIAPAAQPLPSIYRKDPKLYPRLTEADTGKGVYNLVNRGMIPNFVDVTPAFFSEPAPFTQQPVRFHNYHSQFDKASTQVQHHSFDLANLKLDLAEEIFKPEEEQKQQSNALILTQPLEQAVAIKPVLLDFPTTKYDSETDDDEEEDQGASKQDEIPSQPEPIRDYDELLDTYSLHQFIIRKGKTLASTPEFVSFQRKYSFMWGQVRIIIQKLEAFLTKYSIALAYVNGQKVVALADDEMHEPSLNDLLNCLENVDKVGLLMKVPGQRYRGEDAEPAAAAKIQATYRMYRQRLNYKDHLMRSSQARVIQAAWKRYMILQATREQIADRWRNKLSAWHGMWDGWKSTWNSFCKKKRVVVHIPSMSYQPYQRRNLHNFTIRQNSQLCRLMDVQDPNVDVLYITPFELNPDIQQYYLKLLEVGGITDGVNRIKMLVPEVQTKYILTSSPKFTCISTVQPLSHIMCTFSRLA